MRRLAVVAAALLTAAGCGSSKPSDDATAAIAFAGAECCGEPEQIPLDIWLMNEDGSGGRRLTRHPSSERDPRWSPDGHRLVVEAEGALYLVGVDGNDRRQLVRAGIHPSWSPTGNLIAFSRDAHGYVIGADGAGLRRLGDGFPEDWSPDGKKIAFTRYVGDTSQTHIYVLEADGSGARRVSRPASSDSEADRSPDGTRIAFVGVRGTSVVSADVYVMNADGTGERRLTKFPQGDGECFDDRATGIDWSPDGEWIAFALKYVGCDKLGDIYLVRPDGNDLRRVTNSGFSVDPAWRPAGRGS